MDFSPITVLGRWGDRLLSPFGIVLVILMAIYIYLRISGRIGGFGGGSSNSSVGKNKADYVIK